jgi:hypothetical protein
MNRKPEQIALNALPDLVYRQTVERLAAGQKVSAVARWLMMQRRGALQHEVYYNIRKHVDELKFCIAADEQGPAGSATTLVPPTCTEQSACQVVPSLKDATLRELQDVTANADRNLVSARAVLQLTLIDAVEQLKFERRQQQTAGQSGGMRLQVRKEICLIGEVLVKLEHAEQQSGSHGDGDWQNFGRIILPTELTPGQQKLQQMAAEMSPTSRMHVNEALTSVRRILKLDKEARQIEAEMAADKASEPPSTPPAEST